ncbi:hypothetical protein [Streptomyces sp. NPDC048106]|uniref:hypothetical protein n=1 Tax=Streptomyces sp. NPDC048106 TaxID=3155750 RepID=UPI0034571FEE
MPGGVGGEHPVVRVLVHGGDPRPGPHPLGEQEAGHSVRRGDPGPAGRRGGTGVLKERVDGVGGHAA